MTKTTLVTTARYGEFVRYEILSVHSSQSSWNYSISWYLLTYFKLFPSVLLASLSSPPASAITWNRSTGAIFCLVAHRRVNPVLN